MSYFHFKNTHINPFFDQKSPVFKNKSPVLKNKSAVQKRTEGQGDTHPCLSHCDCSSLSFYPPHPKICANQHSASTLSQSAARRILSTNQQSVFPRAGGATCWTLAPEVPSAPIRSQLSKWLSGSGKSTACLSPTWSKGQRTLAWSRAFDMQNVILLYKLYCLIELSL